MSNASRSLGLFSVIAMVVSLQLGFGMFLLPSLLAPYGVLGISSWVISGLGAMVLCHVFSALSQAHPMVGGPHVYIEHAFGKRLGFYVGWTYWVLGWLASAPLVMMALHSVENLLPSWVVTGVLSRIGFQVILLWALMMLNIRGSQLSGLGERLFGVLKLLPLMILPLISIPFWSTDLLTAPITHTPLAAVSGASLLTFWGFVGLEAGTTIADSVKNPKKIIPKALFWGTVLALLVYIINTGSILAVVPREILMNTPNSYGALLDRCCGSGWGKLIDLTILIVCIGSLNSWILAGGSVIASGAKSHIFPSFFGQMNRYNSPAIGIKLTTLCLLLCVVIMHNQTLYNKIEQIISLSTALYMGIYLLSVAALVHLIRTNRIPKSPLLMGSIVLSGLFCLWIVSSLPWMCLAFSLFIPMTGYGFARFFRWPVR
jgi:APA family basic amino acid/polyamine antiporter